MVEEEKTSDASKADRIAHATKRTITEKIEEDPAFYKQFSEMLEETIEDYYNKRISEKEYLSSIVDLTSKIVVKDRGQDLPSTIFGNEHAEAFFGVLEPVISSLDESNDSLRAEAAEISLKIIEIIKAHHIVDVWKNPMAQNKLRNAVDDYFFDVVRDKKGLDIPIEKLDEIELNVMDLARARFPG